MTRTILAMVIAAVCMPVGVRASDGPRPRVAVAPEYPALANYARVAGEVVVVVVADATGTPTRTTVSRGHPLLDESALEAAREWRFEGAGQAILTFAYTLVAENACNRKVLPRFNAPYAVEVRARKLTGSCSDCENVPVVYERCE